jgi:hypothetical protein
MINGKIYPAIIKDALLVDLNRRLPDRGFQVLRRRFQ